MHSDEKHAAQIELKAATVSEPIEDGIVQDVVKDEEEVMAFNEHPWAPDYVTEEVEKFMKNCVSAALQIK